MLDDEESQCTGHEPCPQCGSKDNLGRYSDGHGFCFGCAYWEAGDGERGQPAKVPEGLIEGGLVRKIASRAITQEACAKFNFRHIKFKEKDALVADYYNSDGKLVAQKLRFLDKTFMWLGDAKQVTLFGAQLWGKGRKIVITEGEIDAISMAQVQGLKWPVVSVPNGAQGAVKAISKNLQYLANFEEVILMFDMDEPGQEAAVKCAEVLGPGRCKIATLSRKDPNEMLVAGEVKEMVSAMWNARAYQPEGILAGADMYDLIMEEEDSRDTIQYPWEALNTLTHGLRRSEITTFTAGTGIGKTAIVRELAYHLGNGEHQTVGMIMLEESTKRSALGMLSIHASRPLHLDREGVTKDDMKGWFDATLGTGRYHFIDHFGSTEMDTLLNRIRYLVTSCGCDWIILDHLSIVISGTALESDERKMLDVAMTRLRTLVQELGFGLLLVHHLKRPDGKGHERGAEVTLSQLRGSQAIAQLSDMVIGVERDQQGEDPNLSTVRVLKNRFSGETGVGGYLRYVQETGRLIEGSQMFPPVAAPDDIHSDKF